MLQEPVIDDVFTPTKKRTTKYLIAIIFLVILIASIIILVILLRKKGDESPSNIIYDGTEILCEYITEKKNQEIEIINESIEKDYEFYVIINGKKMNKLSKYTFEEPEQQNITFKFKQNLTSLAYFFYDIDAMIYSDLSKIDSEKLTNISNLFGNCYNLENVFFGNFSTKNVKDMQE